MPAQTFEYRAFKKSGLTAQTYPRPDWLADTIKIILLTSNYVNMVGGDVLGHVYYSDLLAYAGGNEIPAASGYTAGGLALASKVVLAVGSNYYVDAADPSWAASTITARGAAILKWTGAANSSPLIQLIDFGADQFDSNGTFIINFAPTGILIIQ
jgi:hypothetical protein